MHIINLWNSQNILALSVNNQDVVDLKAVGASFVGVLKRFQWDSERLSLWVQLDILLGARHILAKFS